MGSARSWTHPAQIALQTNVTRMVIAHELTHLLQGNLGCVPHGEKACDIWTVARLPVDMLDSPPSYLLHYWHRDRWLRNKLQVKMLCEMAIDVRKSERFYIKWLTGELRKLK